MPPSPAPAQVLAALPRIFPQEPANHAHGQLKVTLDKEVTADQFMQLAELAVATGCAPRVVRSGAGVSVVFS